MSGRKLEDCLTAAESDHAVADGPVDHGHTGVRQVGRTDREVMGIGGVDGVSHLVDSDDRLRVAERATGVAEGDGARDLVATGGVDGAAGLGVEDRDQLGPTDGFGADVKGAARS